MLLLTSTSDLIQVVTGSAADVEVHASWVDNNAGTITPGRTNTASITTATTTTVVGSPGSSIQRNVKHLNIYNNHASNSTLVTVQHTDGTNVEVLWEGTLLASESIVFDDNGWWTKYNVLGIKVTATILITLGTEQETTPGTFIDFSIPTGAKRISMNLVGVSSTGTSDKLFQLGDGGGIENTGYSGAGGQLDTTPTVSNYTAGFGVGSVTAAGVLHGSVIFTLEDQANFTWVCIGVLVRSDGAAMHLFGGSKSLSAELIIVRLTTVGGTDTFDAGAINITVEF